MLLFFLSNNLFFFHLLGNFLYVVCCILWETEADDVILDFLCAYLAHHIVCVSNSRIIYHSIMLILNKEVIATVFSWREIDFGEVRSISLVVFLSLCSATSSSRAYSVLPKDAGFNQPKWFSDPVE